ncbi:MAG: hypothetical protein JSR83_11740 [Proteobacteria bacterium]|nr:hypothetical protein [Pseudomonadota bacterium]
MKRAIHGYVLLEALVALLIFSLGLLGMIGFQAASTRIVTDARFRTEAAILTDELLAKMAVDRRDLVLSNYPFNSDGSGASGATSKVWFDQRVVAGSKLPNAKAQVAVSKGDAADTFIVTVVLQWDLPGATDATKSKVEHGVYETTTMLF